MPTDRAAAQRAFPVNFDADPRTQVGRGAMNH